MCPIYRCGKWILEHLIFLTGTNPMLCVQGTDLLSMMALSSTTQIDSLPECLILIIFSFLSATDAIRASLVCREWRNLWHRVSSLSFDVIPFHSPLNRYSQTRESFTEFVKQALLVRPPNPLRKLFIRFDCDSVGDCTNLKSWINYAIRCGVRELDLDLRTGDLYAEHRTEVDSSDEDMPNYVEYSFDFSCLMNCPIEDLKLRFGTCEFTLLPTSVKSANLTSLLSLTLDDVPFARGDEDLICLVRNCTNLEHLAIINCDLRKHTIVSSRLKTCKITSEMKSCLLITAPCLQSLLITNVWLENDLSNGCPNLIKLELDCWVRLLNYYDWWCDTLGLVTWIKCLVVPNMYFAHQFIFPPEEKPLPPYNFYNITHLEVHTGYSISDIRGICKFLEYVPAVEQLILDYRFTRHHDETLTTEDLASIKASLHIPLLERVKMKNYRGIVAELYVVELLKTHSVVLNKTVAYPAQSGEQRLKPFILFQSS